MSSSTGKVACSLGTSLSSRQLVAGVKQLIPALTSARHKGQAGRIGIVGGSRDYTGAPFFASMSSMRLGSDLCYTICSPDAGSVIKTYSPDLIVNRVLNPDVGLGDVESEVDALFARFHAVVIGPGLGRDEFMQSCARLCIKLARKRDMYIVLDADALWLVQNEPDVIKGYSKAVLTPNKAEFARLCNTLSVDADQDPDTAAHKLAVALNGPTILQKGGVDRITNGKEEAHVDAEGSLKRCGGQGDILAGCLGTFAGWAAIYAQEHTVAATASTPGELALDNLLLYAGYGAALTARACSRRAFEKHRRAMLAHDLLAEVGASYQELWE